MTTSPFDADRPPDEPRRRRGRRSRGRRGDPNATVPDVEFTSYYGSNVVKPPPWGHEISAYLFLGGLAAGSGLLAAGAHATGRPRLRRRSRFAALAALTIGGAALTKDLGRPERALNMMRTLKVTSPMSVGSWILTAFGAFAGAAVAVEVARPMLPDDGALGTLVNAADVLTSAGSAFFAPPLAAYTAVLLSDTASPLWHESYRELPAVFVSSATAAGCGLAMITTSPSETGPVRSLAALAATSDLVADELMARRLGMLAEPLHGGTPGQLHDAARLLTAAGGLGAVVVGRWRVGAIASGLALLAGSVCTRFGMVEAGIESAKNPKYTMVPQRERADCAAAEGRGVTQPGGAWPQ